METPSLYLSPGDGTDQGRPPPPTPMAPTHRQCPGPESMAASLEFHVPTHQILLGIPNIPYTERLHSEK